MEPRSETSTRDRVLAAAVHAAALAVAAHGLAGAARQRAWLERWVAALDPQLAFVAVGALAAAASIVVAARGRAASPGRLVRGAFVAAVATAAAYVAARQPFRGSTWSLTAAEGAAAFALVARAGAPLARRLPRAARAFDRVSLSLAFLLVAGEVGLRALARVRPSPVLQRGAGPAERRLRLYRLDPGELHFGFPADERGFVDDPPRAPGDRARPLVVSISDSFGIGVVPHAWHFTTVAEREHGAVEVYNVAAPGIGPPEYAWLLREEVLPLEPDLVVVWIFVGNDLVARGLAEHGHASWRGWLDRSEVLTVQVPARLAALRSERRVRGGTVGDVAGRTRFAAPTRDVEVLRAGLPWLDDPALERPTQTPERFLALEVRRARAALSPRTDLTRLTGVLDEMASHGMPLALAIVPDEMQIEDDLWQRVRDAAGEALERGLPQRRLADWARSRGVPCLDLLPALRAVPPLPDGRRHVYHLFDTHWNARGNAVAGRELARFLRRLR